MNKTIVLRDELSANSLWALLRANWRALAEQGKPLSITIAKHRAKRSNDQNKRYWAILNEISESAWIGGKQFNSDVWHEFMRRKFIGSEELPDGGLTGISTTTLSVEEFTDYMDKIEVYAVDELGVIFNF